MVPLDPKTGPTLEEEKPLDHRCEVRNTEVRNTRINTRITYYGIWKYNTLRIANFDRVLLDTFRPY